jgi:hypothetical protein
VTSTYRWLVNSLFIVGIIIISVNIYGLFIPLRNPEIKNEIQSAHKNDITLSQDQIYSAINSDTKDKRIYARKMTETINNGIAHYWREEGIDKYHLRIPFYNNFILFGASYFMPEKFLKYEFADYHRAIDRGLGQCSQHAIILAEVLYEKGIKSKMVGLSGHVVATAQVDEASDEWWILDGDYGVVIPADLATIEKNPEIIVPYYSKAGYDQETISFIERVYGKEGNQLIDGFGIGKYSILTNYFEKASYVLIWLIPISFLLPFLYFRFISRKTRNKNSN